jgi:hypothetical protein
MQIDSWQGLSMLLAALILLMQVLLGGSYFARVASCGPGNTRLNKIILLFQGIFWPISTLTNVFYMAIYMTHFGQRVPLLPGYDVFQWLRILAIIFSIIYTMQSYLTEAENKVRSRRILYVTFTIHTCVAIAIYVVVFSFNYSGS